jgi:hypothetical protein
MISFDKLQAAVFDSLFHNCRTSLNDLNNKARELFLLETDPEFFIYEYFQKMTNQIDTVREELKLQIDAYSLSLINELHEIQVQCNLRAHKITEFTGHFKQSKQLLDELNKKFDLLQLNDRNLTAIANKANELKSKIAEEIKECQWFLLKDRTYEFERQIVDVKSVLGLLKSTDRQVV